MLQTDLSSYNNSEFIPGSAIKRVVWYFLNIILFKSSLPWPSSIKCFLLNLFGATVGKNVTIKPNVNIKYPWFLEIGDHVWIGENAWIDNLSQVKIGSNVCISQGALLLSGNHNYKKVTFDLILKPIVIEKGAWIGANSTVVQGVKIGSHAVLGVGSVANRDLDAYSINQGNPAVKIRDRIIA